jgi:four helix bundle protein
VAKISDAEGEAAETQTWLDFSLTCSYIPGEEYNTLNETYENIIGKLVNMSLCPENWSW